MRDAEEPGFAKLDEQDPRDRVPCSPPRGRGLHVAPGASENKWLARRQDARQRRRRGSQAGGRTWITCGCFTSLMQLISLFRFASPFRTYPIHPRRVSTCHRPRPSTATYPATWVSFPRGWLLWRGGMQGAGVRRSAGEGCPKRKPCAEVVC